MYHNIFWGLILLWLACDLYILAFHNRKKAKIESERFSKYIMIFLIMFGMFGGFLIVPSSGEAFLEPFNIYRSISYVFIIFGILLRVISVLQLGKNFSVDVELSKGLYKKGLYSLIRHPSYLGELLCFYGAAIALNHPVTSSFAIFFPTLAFSYHIY